MADQEVTIFVNQEAKGTAIKDAQRDLEKLKATEGTGGNKYSQEVAQQYPQTVARLNQLQQRAAQLATQYGDDDPLVKSTRAKAATFEADLARANKERVQAAQAHLRALRGAEVMEREGLPKGLRQVGSSAVRGFEHSAGIPGGGIISALSNPYALVALAVGTVAGTILNDQKNRWESLQRQESARKEGANRSRMIESGEFGLSQTEREAAAAGDFQENKHEIDKLRAKRGTYHDEGWIDMAKSGWNAFKNSSFAKFAGLGGFAASLTPDLETSGNKAGREAEEEIARREKETKEKQRLAEKEFREGTGGMELQRRREILSGHMREAREVEHAMLRKKEHDTVKEKTGSEELAGEAGDLAVQEQVRKEAMMAAGMVNARSGTKDVARIVGLATGEIRGHHGDNLGQTMRELHEDGKAHAGATNFFRKNLRGE